MAAEIDRLISKKTGNNPHLSKNHIRCFCHKVALILNAGLQSIQLSTKGLVQSQNETLGYVPDLAPILEDSEETEEASQFAVEDVILGSDNNNQICNSTNKEDSLDVTGSDDPESWETPAEGKNPVDKILKKVDFVIQRITSSAVKQSEYNTWSKILDINGPSLIAGYGA
ncbi:hypothetical protein PCASD_12206 [Puccinia coronata f. sp. avenae]|uniref:HAT C-terminal dimerisation domain-containing protein n=1 Tax=Puccinia coronata f. sp. avenae TaxID=200324 RepID=A0A2N5UIW3_9BASI|nr:hypothetical protein PCASD_12206 [Puccinia coronata f. sp. avenae]